MHPSSNWLHLSGALGTLLFASSAAANVGIEEVAIRTTAGCLYQADLEQAIKNAYVDPSNSSCMVIEKGRHIYVVTTHYLDAEAEGYWMDRKYDNPKVWEIIRPDGGTMWFSTFDLEPVKKPNKAKSN
jgi:hypothetical protein